MAQEFIVRTIIVSLREDNCYVVLNVVLKIRVIEDRSAIVRIQMLVFYM